MELQILGEKVWFLVNKFNNMTVNKLVANNNNIKLPAIYGFSGVSLRDDEKYFFNRNTPLGFILFSRNIENPTQLKNLTESIKEISGGEVLILIDQEGGRVSRMKPPEWKPYPAGQYFDSLYKINPEQAKIEIFENFLLIAEDLKSVGINVNCAPILDLTTKETHSVIGDRALGDNPKQVSDLAKEICRSLLHKGVYPIIKHIPGHGRGNADSHLELPIVNATIEELISWDFQPFIELANHKFAMTAHILYQAIDSQHCATFSSKVIDMIRNLINFKNLLMTDDLSMKALTGNYEDKTAAAISAGCDIILHCNGSIKEMQDINKKIPRINDKIREKLAE
jgi:beta-N-acetylhexosaminidase